MGCVEAAPPAHGKLIRAEPRLPHVRRTRFFRCELRGSICHPYRARPLRPCRLRTELNSLGKVGCWTLQMLRAGDSVGRYLIERRLGHGGMGTLYLAHDPVLDRAIALKLLLGDIDLPGARERFVREARAAAALSNPNIVTIYDYGDYESQPYIVMEYIHGETLADLIRRRPEMPIAIKLRWVEELCTAVGYAHGRGIIHRDIKPANLMIDSYGQLKVLDFGIARMRGTLATNATALVGTPGYCAPEQIRGGQIDHRSDLFSIGAVCYELLSYTEAFRGDSVHVITNRILNEETPPLSRVCDGIDGELEGVVMKALQKPADERFASADALCKALADVRVRLETDSDMTIRYVSPIAALPPRRFTPASGAPSPGRPGTDRGSRDAAVTAITTPAGPAADRARKRSPKTSCAAPGASARRAPAARRR